jgi:hypothetical protein
MKGFRSRQGDARHARRERQKVVGDGGNLL